MLIQIRPVGNHWLI